LQALHIELGFPTYSD